MKTSLDKKITLAMLGVATSVMALFCLIVGLATEELEHGLLNQLVIQEFSDIKRDLALKEPDALPYNAQVRTWLTTGIRDPVVPEVFRDLPLGIHHGIYHDYESFHVLREVIDDQILTLAYDITLVEKKERQMDIILMLSILLAPVLVMLLSYIVANRLVRPIAQLAERLKTLDPADGASQPLATFFQGQEVAAIAEACDRYAERIEQLVEREKSFSAAVSHELRNPLSVIGASAELLEHGEQLTEPGNQQLARINKSVTEMTDLVTSILALTNNRRPTMRAPLHVYPVLEDVMANYRGMVDSSLVTLELKCANDLTVWIPVGDVLILVNNLLQNAVRNTERGSITLFCDRECVVVSDTGRGMPDEFAAYAFDKHSHSYDSHGVGLGLHIVKRLCDQHGWAISLESALGEGTTVSVAWSSFVHPV